MARKVVLAVLIIVVAVNVAAWVYERYAVAYEHEIRQKMKSVLDTALAQRLKPHETIDALMNATSEEWTFTLFRSDRPSVQFDENMPIDQYMESIDTLEKITAGIDLPRMRIYPRSYVVTIGYREGRMDYYRVSPIYD